MPNITIELPDDLVPPATTPNEFVRELRLAAAIHWYSRGQISQSRELKSRDSTDAALFSP